MEYQWLAYQTSDTQVQMNSFDVWIYIFTEFIYITPLSYTKQSHFKKGVSQNVFKQTWCTSRNLGTSEEISSTPVDVFFCENSKPSTYLPSRQHTWKIVFDQSFGYRHKVFTGQYHLAQTIFNKVMMFEVCKGLQVQNSLYGVCFLWPASLVCYLQYWQWNY